MIDYRGLERRCDDLRRQFRSATPFPHLVIDGFFEETAARAIHAAFPPVDPSFKARVHLHSRKYTKERLEEFPGPIRAAFEELHGARFLALLGAFTGIEKLTPDPDLFGAGIHQSRPGGFLDVHADFTIHPELQMRRILNGLIYFNPDWKEDYRGYLELWDREVRRCVQRIAPAYNRCVLFETSDISFHGHPDPLACPEDMARKSLTVYYYRPWVSPAEPRLKTTDYRPRPVDYGKRLRKWVARRLGPRLSDRIRRILGRR